MQLRQDEEIVLDNGSLGFRKKLTLTNKRLIFQRGKGFVNITWIQENEIPLEEIEEAYVEPGGVFFTLSRAMLKMKNQVPFQMGLALSDIQTLGSAFTGEQMIDVTWQMKTLNDRWVYAINHQLNKRLP